MGREIHATLVSESDEDWAARSGAEKDVQVEIRIQTPFSVVKGMHDEDDGYMKDEDDVIVQGPVYVGDQNMLDRHRELVDMSAIKTAWEGYSRNPVILYNHSKTYGVIGRMTDVTIGTFDGIEGEVPIGRAVIDGGEKDIVRKIRKGMLKAFSIGFIAKAAVKECKGKDDCYMRFTEIDWLETSVVDVPASPGAIFSVEKHVIGYEDRGDSIALVFEKEPPSTPDQPVENSAGCGCGGVTEDTCGCDDHLTYDEDFRPEDYADVEGRLELIEAYIEALEERGMASTSVNSPLAKGHGQGTTMTDDLITESEEEALVTEEAVEIPTEEVVKHDGPDELTEELATEESSEEAEAAEESEEAAEELEEETGEKSVLADLVSVIIDLDARLKGIENTIQTAESLNATISELKTTIATRDAELDALKAEKEAAEAEAALEAEVSKRVADRLASVGVSAPATPERKSLAPITDAPVKKSVTDYDPQPNVTPGMNGLATWLAENLAGRKA